MYFSHHKWIQVSALCRKNLLILRRSWFWTLFRAYLLPIAFMVFMAEAKHFFIPYAVYGVSNPTAIHDLVNQYNEMDIAYYSADPKGLTDPMRRIMKQALDGIPSKYIHELNTMDELYSLCRGSLNGVSRCYGAIEWNSIDEENGIYNYTVRSNSGFEYVNMDSDGKSAADVYILPLQWAVDKAIGNFSSTPMSMPYTSQSQEQYKRSMNRRYMRTVVNWLAPALFLSMIGVVYHVSGFIAQEREQGMTGLLTSMGVSKTVRLISTHISFSAVYFFGWIILGAIYTSVAFTESNAAISIFYHIFSGFSLVSYSIFLGNLFKSAQLAGIIASGFSVFLALMTTVQTQVADDGPKQSAAIYILSWLFPPCNYAYFISSVGHWQVLSRPANMVQKAPDTNMIVIVIFMAAIFQIFLYFIMALAFEQFIYSLKKHPVSSTVDELSAVEVRGLTKSYKQGNFFTRLISPRKRKPIVAVDSLSLNIGKNQIVSLLGANGSGKTTTLEILSGIQALTDGQVTFSPGSKVGICPQKNVLWDKLTVGEHVEIWQKLKSDTDSNDIDSDTLQLVEKCDLTEKCDTFSKNLSGGQKRKLQLAIMFVGGSNVCFIDEVSSGLDPVSRRKIWDILLEHREGHAQVLTTHFLDEADICSDKIAIVSKGVLKAEGSSVELKHSLGGGTRIIYRDPDSGAIVVNEYKNMKEVIENAEILQEKNIPFRVSSAELENAFLTVASHDHDDTSWDDVISSSQEMAKSMNSEIEEHVGFWGQMWALLLKRFMIARRNPLPELATVLVPIIVVAACRSFLVSYDVPDCTPGSDLDKQDFTYLEPSKLRLVQGTENQIFGHQAGLQSFARNIESRYQQNSSLTTENILGFIRNRTTITNDEPSFKDLIERGFRSVYPGGIYLDPKSKNPLLSYMIDGHDFGSYTSTTLLNYMNNVILNGSRTLITNYSPFQVPWATGTGDTMQFALYVGLSLCAAPAFLSLYPTFERLNNVKAMHYSNGLRILPLWTSYLIYSTFLWIIISAVLIGIIAGANSQIENPGYLFLVLLIYGISASLSGFVLSLFSQSQLAAFASTAAYLAICLLVYLIAYLSEMTYGSPVTIPRNLKIVDFTISILGPPCSLERSLFLSMNLFSSMCDSNNKLISWGGHILSYGRPILYLLVQGSIYFLILIWWDSGEYRWNPMSIFRRKRSFDMEEAAAVDPKNVPGISEEIQKVETCADEYKSGLRVSHVTKIFGNKNVVDDVSFGVTEGETFALLGPNGAGKTTMFNMIRGEIWPSSGEVYVSNYAVTSNRSAARTKLGVCPQFDAMDKLTVIETLYFYARLRGLQNVNNHVERVITAVGIDRFRNRIANNLSGGNKRKLSLGVALICNPQVLLLDEPSSGMDAFAKRIMWKTLSAVSKGRSIVLTTHSMEEADALADRAGFLAGRILAVGGTDQLRMLYGNYYHVHLICKSAPSTPIENMQRIVDWAKQQFDGVKTDDRLFQGQIRLSIPLSDNVNIASIFRLFEEHGEDLGIDSYTVSPTRLEEVFLQIISYAQTPEEGYSKRVQETSMVEIK